MSDRVITGSLTYAEYRAIWETMTESERERARLKAAYEHMSLWAVLNDWPSLRAQHEPPAGAGA